MYMYLYLQNIITKNCAKSWIGSITERVIRYSLENMTFVINVIAFELFSITIDLATLQLYNYICIYTAAIEANILCLYYNTM